MDTSWIHPFLADIAECVSCGKCLPDCPLYDYHRREEWSPRGKLNVLKWYLASGGHPTPASAVMFFQCTLCLRCQDACPSGIAMHDIFQAARANLERLGLAPHAPCLGRAIRGGEATPGPLCRAIATAMHRARLRRASRVSINGHGAIRPARSAPPKAVADPEPSGTAGMLLLSPLLASEPSGAAGVAASVFRRAGYAPKPRILAGVSLFRRFWGGDREGLRAAVEAAEATLPAGVPRLFAEPELAAWWREAGGSAGSVAAVVDLPDIAIRQPAMALPRRGRFTVLPPPVPLDGAGWKSWNERWRPLEGTGWVPVPDGWRPFRAEGLIPWYPATARILGRSLLAAASLEGFEELVSPSVRTAAWLRGAGSPEGRPRLSLLPIFLEQIAR